MPTPANPKSTKSTKGSKSAAAQVTAPAATPPLAPPPVVPPAPPPAVTPPQPIAASASAPPPSATLGAYVQQAVSALDAAESGLAVDPPALTAAQKRHAGKLRAGGDKAVAQIGNLARQFGVESSVLQVDAMLLALTDAQALAPLVTRLQAFQKHVGDLLFLWQSAAWADAMQFYALLQRRSSVDGSVATNLAPVSAFFAKRHGSTKVAGATPKRTAKANAKAVKRLKKAAPQLLASSQPAAGGGSEEAAAAPAPATPNGANGTGGTSPGHA